MHFFNFFSDLTMFVQFKNIHSITGVTQKDDGFLYCSLYNRTDQLLAESKVVVAVKRKSNVTEISVDKRTVLLNLIWISDPIFAVLCRTMTIGCFTHKHTIYSHLQRILRVVDGLIKNEPTIIKN